MKLCIASPPAPPVCSGEDTARSGRAARKPPAQAKPVPPQPTQQGPQARQPITHCLGCFWCPHMPFTTSKHRARLHQRMHTLTGPLLCCSTLTAKHIILLQLLFSAVGPVALLVCNHNTFKLDNLPRHGRPDAFAQYFVFSCPFSAGREKNTTFIFNLAV